jgi:hypothetical protein
VTGSFRLADGGTVGYDVLAVWTDANGLQFRRGEHTNVILSSELIAIVTLRHGRHC